MGIVGSSGMSSGMFSMFYECVLKPGNLVKVYWIFLSTACSWTYLHFTVLEEAKSSVLIGMQHKGAHAFICNQLIS